MRPHVLHESILDHRFNLLTKLVVDHAAASTSILARAPNTWQKRTAHFASRQYHQQHGPRRPASSLSCTPRTQNVSCSIATIATRGMSQSSAGEHGKVGRRHRMKYVIALGSNLGDRVEWIERALREMEAVDIRILSTSSLWQTPPMYVEDQNDFVNGACVVSTELQPISLMLQLQDIEKKLMLVEENW